jgi:hypothetical protein
LAWPEVPAEKKSATDRVNQVALESSNGPFFLIFPILLCADAFSFSLEGADKKGKKLIDRNFFCSAKDSEVARAGRRQLIKDSNASWTMENINTIAHQFGQRPWD